MNDKTARRLQKSAVVSSMKFSEKNAIDKNGAAKYGTNLLNTTAIIGFNNIEHLLLVDLVDNPRVTVLMPTSLLHLPSLLVCTGERRYGIRLYWS